MESATGPALREVGAEVRGAARIRDVRYRDVAIGDVEAWLVEPARAASEPKELLTYEGDHALRDAGARADRLAFLAEVLGFEREDVR